METDIQAVTAYQSGDSEAFGVLYDRYIKKIYDFVYFRTTHKETAEDLTSQVFTKALENLSKFKSGSGTFQAWLYRIARNTIIDHYRTSKPTTDIDDVPEVSLDQDMAKDVDLSVLGDRIHEYLLTIQEEHRDLIIMRVYDGLSYKEIAEILGKSEASCKMGFSRSISKLREELGSQALLILLTLLITHYHG